MGALQIVGVRENTRVRDREVKNLIIAILLVSVAAVASAQALPWFEERLLLRRRYQADSHTRQCGVNQHKLGTALEMYSTDNVGRYPTSLRQLVPNYLKSIPTCPAAGSDTYSSSFRSTANRNDYTLICKGWHFGPVDEQNVFPRWRPPDELDYVHNVGVLSF